MSFSARPRCAAPVLGQQSTCPSCLPAILAGLFAGCGAEETKGDGIGSNCDGEDDT